MFILERNFVLPNLYEDLLDHILRGIRIVRVFVCKKAQRSIYRIKQGFIRRRSQIMCFNYMHSLLPGVSPTFKTSIDSGRFPRLNKSIRFPKLIFLNDCNIIKKLMNSSH